MDSIQKTFIAVPLAAVGATATAQALRVFENREEIMYKPTNIHRVVNCWKLLTSEEYKTQGFDANKENVRKINLYIDMAFKNDKHHEDGVLDDSINIALNKAKQSNFDALQLKELFLFLLNPKSSNEVISFNIICADLLDLYSRKNAIETNINVNFTIEDAIKYSKELEIIKLQLEVSRNDFINYLKKVFLGISRTLGKDGYQELLNKIKTNPLDEIFNFLQVYVCKVKYLTDNDYAKEFQTALSNYIFARSAGVISADLVIKAKYGKIIAEMLSDSFLGDINASNSYNPWSDNKILSKYFLQTLYFLLDDGKKDFSLECLCIGSGQKNTNITTHKFKIKDDNKLNAYIYAHTDDYDLYDRGVELVTQILNYYCNLSEIKIKDSNILIKFEEEDQKILLWNLLGGRPQNSDNNKKGLFFHLDAELRNFDTDINIASNIYKSHRTLNQEYREQLINDTKQKAEVGLKNIAEIGKKSPFELELHAEKQQLAEIAKQVIIQINFFPDNNRVLQTLRQEYDLIIESVQSSVSPETAFNCIEKLRKYFTSLVNLDNPKRFDIFENKTTTNFEKYVSQLNNKFITPLRLIDDFLDIQKNKFEALEKNKFELNFIDENNKVDEYLKEYTSVLDSFVRQLEQSSLFKHISSIFSDLNKLNNFTKFCEEIDKGAAKVSEGMLRIAPIHHLIFMGENCITISKKSVRNIYNYYIQLKKNIEAKNISEENIIEYAMLELLFDFVDKKDNFDNYFISKFTEHQIDIDNDTLQNGIYKTIDNKYIQIIYGNKIKITSKNNKLNDLKIQDMRKLTYNEIDETFDNYVKNNNDAVKDFIDIYDRFNKNNIKDNVEVKYRSFKIIHQFYNFIPKVLVNIYLSPKVINYFEEAYRFINDNIFQNYSELDKETTWNQSKFKNLPSKQDILLQQDVKILLTQTINKIKDNIGKLTYVKSSIKAIDSSNRFRLKNTLEFQLDILKELMIITNDGRRFTNDSPYSDSQSNFCTNITKYIKYIDKLELSSAQVWQIFIEITDYFKQILNNGSEIRETINKYKDENIQINLPECESKNLFNLYKELSKIEFSVSLEKIPVMYLGKLQNIETKLGIMTKVFRLIEAFFSWNMEKKLCITDIKNDKKSEYGKIIDIVSKLQNLNLTSLAAIQYIHNQLKSCFSITNQGVFELATNLSPSISLIQKLVIASTSGEILEISLLDDHEKYILKKFREIQYVKKQDLGDVPKQIEIQKRPIIDQSNLSIVQVSFNNDNYSYDLQTLIKFIKENFENKSEVSQIEERVTIFENKVNLIHELNNIQIQLENFEKLFKKNIKDFAENLKKLDQNKNIKTYTNFVPDIVNLTKLINFYKINSVTPRNYSKDSIITHTLSSNALLEIIDLFNLCFNSLSGDVGNATGVTYASLFSTRKILEELVNQVNDEGGLENYKISLFHNLVDLDLKQKDDQILAFVNKYLGQSTETEIEKHLINLISNYKKEHKNIISAKIINEFKYFLNLHQYRILSTQFTEFYIANYFNIKVIEEYYNQTISYIISINQENASKRPISKPYPFNLQRKSDDFNFKYKKYREEGANLLSLHLNLFGKTSGIYQVLMKVKMNSFLRQQNYNVKNHEWLIKMYDINRILSYLNKNDVPHMRMMLYIQGIFDYFETFNYKIFDRKLYNKDILKKIRNSIIEMYGNQQLEKETNKDIFIEINDGLTQLQSLLKNDSKFKQIFNSLIKYFRDLFSAKKSFIELKSKINQDINDLIPVWKSIFDIMEDDLSNYQKDIDSAKDYIAQIESVGPELENLQQLLPKFNFQLNSYCEEELNSNQRMSITDIYAKIAHLIKVNWAEFDILQNDNIDKFITIYNLNFIQSSVKIYLNSNYSNIYSTVKDDNKKVLNCFKKILYFINFSDVKQSLMLLIEDNNIQDNKLLALFLSNSPHQQFFKDTMDNILHPEVFNRLEFSKEIFEFLISNSENSSCSWFTPVFNTRLEQCNYNFKDESPYEQFCKTYTNQGEVFASTNLDVYDHYGEDVTKDLTLAVKDYKVVTDRGDAFPHAFLDVRYEIGRDVTKDILVFDHYKVAADQGHAHAQHLLGLCYEYGWGVTEDLTLAIQYYKLAADQGEADAQYFLGVCYASGQGVPKDLTLAVNYYQLAADQGVAGAQNRLGMWYQLEDDLTLAVKYYKLAADQGNADAQSRLQRIKHSQNVENCVIS